MTRQIDGERALPVGERHVLARGGGAGDAGIVDERIEAAERGRRRYEETVDGGGVRDVAIDLAERRVASRHGRERGAVDVADEDARAFQGERACRREADAGCARGDEHAQPLNLHVHGDLVDGGPRDATRDCTRS